MSDILRQVDDDLRKEKLVNLWKKYGIYTISFVILIIFLIIGYQIIVSIDKSKNENIVELYLSTTYLKNIDEQLLLLEDINDSNNSFLSGLADLKISSLKIENGNIEDGLLQLQSIIQYEEYDPIIRDLATYFLLMMTIKDQNNTVFISDLTRDKIEKSPFKYLFLEMIAIRKLILGEFEEAKKDFENLKSNMDLPIEIRNRAVKFIELTS